MRRRIQRDERGASLILAIVFTVVVGGICGAIIGTVNSGVKDRSVLDSVRDRQYAADAGIERSVTAVRISASPPATLANCGGPWNYNLASFNEINKVPIHVDCIPVPAVTIGGFVQHNDMFTACVGVEGNGVVTCGSSGHPTVIRAQVNFQTIGSGANFVVKRTWVQSWSVIG